MSQPIFPQSLREDSKFNMSKDRIFENTANCETRKIRIQNSSKPHLYTTLKPLADEMRENPTPEEALFWQYINKNKIGIKFRRQHIIDQFIVDFYSIEAQLAIEIDGKIHDEQKERDNKRTEILTALGITVIRFTNEEVRNDIMKVIEKLKKQIKPNSSEFQSPI